LFSDPYKEYFEEFLADEQNDFGNYNNQIPNQQLYEPYFDIYFDETA